MPKCLIKNRNNPSNKRYLSTRRWIRNKMRTLKRHIKKQPNDKIACGTLKELININIAAAIELDL